MMRKILLLFLLAVTMQATAQPFNSDTLRSKSVTLRTFLDQQHYLPLQWNDSSSARLYNRWLEILDDEKLIFSQADINALSGWRTRLDEELMGKEWNFYNKSISIYKAALIRLDSVVKITLAKQLTFTENENFNWPLTKYPASYNDIGATWHKYLKWKILSRMSDELSDSSLTKNEITPLSKKIIAAELKARQQIQKQELFWLQNKLAALTGKDMEEAYLAAIGWCYDPHTTYMSADSKNDFETEMSGLEFSTGFEVEENEKGEWEITYLIPGGPAWRSGELHKGDIILKVQSGKGPEIVLAESGIDELPDLFKGSSNEKIIITIQSPGGLQKTSTLIKEKITNEDGIVKSYVLKGAKNIGYITLPGFYVKEGDNENGNGCSNDVAKEVVKLKKDSIAGLILDLRYNGGGSLGEALELAGIFIGEGSLASAKDKSGKVKFLKDPNRGTIYDGPLLVLVNTLSASASELLAAVLQDYNRALIAGSTTYGKGSSQIILPMDTTGKFSENDKFESYVKVTTGKFYRVDGTTTQWKGVSPDISMPDLYAMKKYRENSNVSALQPDNSREAIYNKLSPIPFAKLLANSKQRVETDKNFNAVSSFAAWLKKMDEGRSVPLQWDAYQQYYKNVRAMYALLDTKADTVPGYLSALNNSIDNNRQMVTDQSKAVNSINLKRIERDGYIYEAYSIMQDWLNELK